ncbi:hypothetical protein PC119_g26711 [Phytophthora cactorum]|nr:hypothetical protein PC119_g26711 [Phytophthora cactorum]KAG2969735.1 hypothetical protein PC120_g26667 [Phytophthora cactorum]
MREQRAKIARLAPEMEATMFDLVAGSRDWRLECLKANVEVAN